MSGKPPLPSTWREGGVRHPKDGRRFLRNHADGIASMDLFVVPTISFLRQSRREILWLGVTAHPSAQWIAGQLSEAYGWQQAPQYIVRDRDLIEPISPQGRV